MSHCVGPVLVLIGIFAVFILICRHANSKDEPGSGKSHLSEDLELLITAAKQTLDSGGVVVRSETRGRELKLRLNNGTILETHYFSCGGDGDWITFYVDDIQLDNGMNGNRRGYKLYNMLWENYRAGKSSTIREKLTKST